jgi:(2Fe-2S) ferredoxin
MPPYERHLFSCLNTRTPDDPRGSCTHRGGDALAEVAREEVHRLGLKDRVRANKAGCLDACALGPVCVVYPDAVWYAPRTEDDMREIVASHLRDGVPVERLVVRDFGRKRA